MMLSRVPRLAVFLLFSSPVTLYLPGFFSSPVEASTPQSRRASQSTQGAPQGVPARSGARILEDTAFGNTIDIAIDPATPNQKHVIALYSAQGASAFTILTLPEHGSLWVGSKELKAVPHRFVGNEVLFQPKDDQVLYQADRFDIRVDTGAPATIFLHFVQKLDRQAWTGLSPLTREHWLEPSFFPLSAEAHATLNTEYPDAYQSIVDRHYQWYRVTIDGYLTRSALRRAEIPALFEYFYFSVSRTDADRQHHLLRLARLLEKWTSYVHGEIAAGGKPLSYMENFYMLQVFLEFEKDPGLASFYDTQLNRTGYPQLPATFADLKKKVVQAMVALDKQVVYYEAGFHNRALEGLAIRATLARLDPTVQGNVGKVANFPLLQPNPSSKNPPVSLKTYLDENLKAWFEDPERRDIIAGSDTYAAHTLEGLFILLNGSQVGQQLKADPSLRRLLHRYLDQVIQLGFIPHRGDALGAVASLAWISVFEQAAVWTEDRRFKAAAFDLFQWIVLRDGDLESWGVPLGQFAMQSIYALLSHRRFSEPLPTPRFESRQTWRHGVRTADSRCTHNDHQEQINCGGFVEFDPALGTVPDKVILEQQQDPTTGLAERHEQRFVGPLQSMSAFLNLGQIALGHGHCSLGSLYHFSGNGSVLLQAPSYTMKDYPFHNVLLFESGHQQNLIDSRWHHVVAQFAQRSDGQGHLTLYVDGLRVAEKVTAAKAFEDTRVTAPNGDVYNYAGRLKIGGLGGEYFDGLIDNIRIYDRALTTLEISNLYAGGQGWSLGRMNGISDLIAFFDGETLVSRVSPSLTLKKWHKDASRTTYPKVNVQGAYDFDGTANLLTEFDDLQLLDLTGKTELTISLWFQVNRKLSDSARRGRLPLLDTSPTPEGVVPYHFALYLDAGRPGFLVNRGFPARTISTSQYSCVANTAGARVKRTTLDTHPLVDYAMVSIEGYQAQHATASRHLVMVKDRFLWVIDDLEATAPLHQARIGPVWQVQTIYGPAGRNFVNSTVQKMGVVRVGDPKYWMQWRNYPYDLLIFSPEGEVTIDPVSHVPDYRVPNTVHFNTNRLRAGFFGTYDLKAGEHQEFVTFLVPHSPKEDPRGIAGAVKKLVSEKGKVVYQYRDVRVGWRRNDAAPFEQGGVDPEATVFVVGERDAWSYSRSEECEECLFEMERSGEQVPLNICQAFGACTGDPGPL